MSYDYKKTIKKFLIISAEIILAGILVYIENDLWYLSFVPILEAARNYLKHRYDPSVKEVIKDFLKKIRTQSGKIKS